MVQAVIREEMKDRESCREVKESFSARARVPDWRADRAEAPAERIGREEAQYMRRASPSDLCSWDSFSRTGREQRILRATLHRSSVYLRRGSPETWVMEMLRHQGWPVVGGWYWAEPAGRMYLGTVVGVPA